VLFAANLFVGSSRRLVAQLGGRTANDNRDARLINIVDGLCAGYGLSRPQLRIVDDPAPNAITLGRSSRSAVVICTAGLFDLLDRMELEGLISHELAHIKRGDLAAARAATTAVGAIAASLPHGGRLVARLAGRRRETYADLTAVSITRYPPGLVAALEKLDAAPTTRPSGLSTSLARLTGAMWCVPLTEAAPPQPVAGVLGLELRVAALREL